MASPDHTIEAAIAGFPDNIQSELRDTLSNGAVVPPDVSAAWLDAFEIEIGMLMMKLLPVAAAYARVPISNFHVGAVALGMPPGSLYLGSNMEFPGQALSFTVHGEQSATNNAWLHGEPGLQALAVNAAPCGYCRQFLYELTTATTDFNILLKAAQNPNDYSYTMEPLTYYLPDAFGPSDLGIKGGLMQPDAHGLTSGGGSTAQAALGAANACYSPYTKDYSGVALAGPAGEIYAGRYAENAAYNPAMSPMESAMAFMNMSLPAQTALDISVATLVEAPADISQRTATVDVLASAAPAVTLEYVEAAAG